MQSGGTLEIILRALKGLRGYFVWRDSDGEEYVIISRRAFEGDAGSANETQLDLLTETTVEPIATRQGWTADDMLDKINHDLALFQLQRDEEEVEEAVEEVENESQFPLPPKPSTFAKASADLPASAGKKVRFEPLRGDLPPELQE